MYHPAARKVAGLLNVRFPADYHSRHRLSQNVWVKEDAGALWCKSNR